MKYIRDISLFESEQHIDHNKIDMRAEFDHINGRLFDGQVKPVQLRWMNSKNTIGLMSYEGQNIRDIGISYYYKMTLQEFRNVLAHEMIHAYLEQKGIRERDAHGPKFTRMREELNKKFPEYNIVKSENAADFEPSAYARVQQYGAAVFQERGTTFSLMVFPVNLLNNKEEVAKFEDHMRKHVLFRLRDPKIFLYKSSYPDLAKFRVKKSLIPKSMELYSITQDQAKGIMDGGELVLEVSPK